MRLGRGYGSHSFWMVALVAGLVVVGQSIEAVAAEPGYQEYRARVDQALKENPSHVGRHALYSCSDRRAIAEQLFRRGFEVRAQRSLKYCFNLLGISEDSVAPEPDPIDEVNRVAAAEKASRDRAAREFEGALALTPDTKNGLEIYRECAACHTPEGWGMSSGMVPQLAGQHRTVVIKQLADIRAGNRENEVMAPYSSIESIGGTQAVADVAGYIDTLEISVENGRGSGDDLEQGERLYQENCARCHGAQGEGDSEKSIPRIQSQHFGYLVTQFESIREGKRRNANPEMVVQIKDFKQDQMFAVLDYVSRLEPPKELQAPPGWRNPDFLPSIAKK